jgi:SagB-type dehydrogenase family enzyme
VGSGDGHALRAYHDRTKHSVASVRAGARPLDWDNQPLPFKVYADLEPIPLPTDLPGSQRLALDAIGGIGGAGERPLDLATLAHILYFSAGVVRQRRWSGGELYFRAAACTGALYHVDVYVVTAALPGLGAGVYHFSPHDFALRLLRAGDHRGHVIAATAGQVAGAPVHLIFASTFWRNAWKYRERTYRHCFWDSGTIAATLLATAAAVDVRAALVTGFVDDALAALVDLDPLREAPLLVAALGDGAPPAPTPAAVAPLGLTVLPLSRTEIDHPPIRDAHAASALPDEDAVRRWRSSPPPAPPRDDAADVPLAAPVSPVREPIEAVILRRGSTRRVPRAPLPGEALSTIVQAAATNPPLDARAPATCYVVAHAVDGLDPGAYVVTPDARGLTRLERGDFRRTTGFLGLGQELPADASACLYWLTDLEPVFHRLGDRGYRVAALEGAIAGGRTYLAAYALGLGASGLTFFDDEVTAFFSPHAVGRSVLFHMAVGPRGRHTVPPDA